MHRFQCIFFFLLLNQLGNLNTAHSNGLIDIFLQNTFENGKLNKKYLEISMWKLFFNNYLM